MRLILSHITKSDAVSGACISDGRPARSFAETLTGRVLPGSVHDASQKQFKTCKSVCLQNGDQCAVGQYVICQNPTILGSTFVARVVEIWQIKGSVEDYSNSPNAILLQSCQMQRHSPTYRMPHIDLINAWSVARFQVRDCQFCTMELYQLFLQDILCTVNVQHNCAQQLCSTAQIRHVYQERERTDQTRLAVTHIRQPDDLVLNTAQMRDAPLLQKFRLRSPDLNADDIITASAAHEIALQKTARTNLETIPVVSNRPSVPSRLLVQRQRALQESALASTSQLS